jgi:Glycosyl hydrolase family 10
MPEHCRQQGRVNTWDVVNEAFCTDGSGSWTQSPILSLLGEGYVSEAFAAARQAEPTCKLLYNDCTVASAGYAKVNCSLLATHIKFSSSCAHSVCSSRDSQNVIHVTMCRLMLQHGSIKYCASAACACTCSQCSM